MAFIKIIKAMQNMSPRKYIQTRARSLPIDKCYVSKGWEDAGLGTVIVVRRHVNKRVTAGLYLVDLKCLGVKDTSWFFNILEDELIDHIPDFEERFMEIGYHLAHNIVYAGHDFAIEFEIPPHREFAVTKYILEEDDERIPVVDIAVGEDGVPHLITHKPNEYPAALVKLKTIAGEGNYYHTTGVGNFAGDGEAEDDEVED